jgi:hypothetical protein
MKIERGNGWELANADCIDYVRSLPDESIDLAFYSPPFEAIYAYSDDPRDMSNCSDSEEFQAHYGFLARELYRVIKPGRIVCVHCMTLPSSKTQHGYIGLRDFPGDLIRTHQRTGMIWHSDVSIWKCPVVAVTRTKALGLLHKQLLKDSCMSRMGIPDRVLMFRKPGVNANPVKHRAPRSEFLDVTYEHFNEGQPVSELLSIEPGDGGEVFPIPLWQKWASPHWDDIDQGDVLPHRAGKDDGDQKHLCVLQLEVYRRCLRLYSNPGDTVLEPFSGVGSGIYVALQEGRKGKGAELKPSYFRQSVANLQAVERRPGDLFAELAAAGAP